MNMQARQIRTITNDYPYPIVSSFVKLRTDECLDPSPLRLKYILSTIEAITRFVGVIVISECRDFAENHPEIETSFSPLFQQQIKRPSWGIWLGFIREGLRWLQQHKAKLLISELYDFYFTTDQKPTKVAQALEKALNIRNALSHEKITAMLQHEFADLCNATYPLLSLVLKALNFLPNYPLTFVSHIEVRKQRKQSANFYHRFKHIVGKSEDFDGERNTFDFYMDSKATLIYNPDTHRFLNLDPLLVYEEAAGKGADVFFFNGMNSPTKAHYTACKHGGVFLSGDSCRAEIIQMELQQLLNLFPQTIIIKGS